MATTRPRGFKEWNPRSKTRQLVTAVQEILEENSDITPLTIRQMFYMLVSNYEYDKTEKAYQRLCETLNRARRAQYIDMYSIRDDELRRSSPAFYEGRQDYIDSCIGGVEAFELDRQRGQDQLLMLWCEAGGMMPQLVKYCEPYGMTVLSSGGFDSVTTKHNIAREISREGKPVEILHVGDHDPSGVHMCSSLDEDVQEFVYHYGGEVSVTRLAVTPEQVESMDLPTAPPKATDNRSFSGLTTQAEAIPPRELKRIVTDAVKGRMDMEVYNAVVKEEAEIMAILRVELGRLK